MNKRNSCFRTTSNHTNVMCAAFRIPFDVWQRVHFKYIICATNFKVYVIFCFTIILLWPNTIIMRWSNTLKNLNTLFIFYNLGKAIPLDWGLKKIVCWIINWNKISVIRTVDMVSFCSHITKKLLDRFNKNFAQSWMIYIRLLSCNMVVLSFWSFHRFKMVAVYMMSLPQSIRSFTFSIIVY